jgi:hypothetical protein
MRLHVLTGPSKGATAEIVGERFVVGRDETCDLVIRDGSVARRHAAFERVSRQTYLLRDLGSAAGTFVRGQRLEGPVALRGNERLTFGSVTAQLVLAPADVRGRRRRPRWKAPAIVAGVLLVVGAALAAVLVSRGGGSEPSFFDAVRAATTAQAAPETPQAAAATAPATAGAGADVTAPPVVPDHPDGPGVIAYARGAEGESDVRVMNPDGSGQGRLAAGDDPAVAPDGRRVAIVDPEGGVDVVPLAGGRPTQWLRTAASGGRALDPDWSPDGTRLVLGDSKGGIEIVKADGSEPLSLGSGSAESPSWAPDGASIALAARVADDTTVVGTVGPDGAGASPLTTVGPLRAAASAGVDWSPDGTRLAFTCATQDPDGETRPDVCVMDADGGPAKPIGGSPGSDSDPSWSPDGSQLAFVSDRDGNDEIYVMDADGGSQRRLTFDPAPDRAPSWGPGAEVERASLTPVLFVDDFSSRESGWEVFSTDRGAASAYDAGGLVLRLPRPGFTATSDSGRAWSGPIVVRVEAASTGPARNAAFGIVCGYRDQRNFTLLGVTADGGYGITRWVDGREQVLASGGATTGSSGVPVGASSYSLAAACGGSRLTLSVAGHVVAHAPGSGGAGSLALFVRTLDRGGASVRFDDVVVTRG